MPCGGQKVESDKQKSPTIIEVGIVCEYPGDRGDHSQMHEKKRHCKGAFLSAFGGEFADDVLDRASHVVRKVEKV